MFTKSAKFYDAIYASAGKGYASETQKICALIEKHKKSPGNTLLDVACGSHHYNGSRSVG